VADAVIKARKTLACDGGPMEKVTDTPGNDTLRQELAEGLLYIHARLSENTTTTLEAASFLYACIELLSEKGLLSIEALDERTREVAKRLVQKNSAKGVGVLLQEPEYDCAPIVDTSYSPV
jgi:hypothetical protein